MKAVCPYSLRDIELERKLLLYQVNLAFGVTHTKPRNRAKNEGGQRKGAEKDAFILVPPESFVRELQERERERERGRKKWQNLLAPACLIFRTVNSLQFCNLFFGHVTKQPFQHSAFLYDALRLFARPEFAVSFLVFFCAFCIFLILLAYPAFLSANLQRLSISWYSNLACKRRHMETSTSLYSDSLIPRVVRYIFCFYRRKLWYGGEVAIAHALSGTNYSYFTSYSRWNALVM